MSTLNMSAAMALFPILAKVPYPPIDPSQAYDINQLLCASTSQTGSPHCHRSQAGTKFHDSGCFEMEESKFEPPACRPPHEASQLDQLWRNEFGGMHALDVVVKEKRRFNRAYAALNTNHSALIVHYNIAAHDRHIFKSEAEKQALRNAELENLKAKLSKSLDKEIASKELYMQKFMSERKDCLRLDIKVGKAEVEVLELKAELSAEKQHHQDYVINFNDRLKEFDEREELVNEQAIRIQDLKEDVIRANEKLEKVKVKLHGERVRICDQDTTIKYLQLKKNSLEKENAILKEYKCLLKKREIAKVTKPLQDQLTAANTCIATLQDENAVAEQDKTIAEAHKVAAEEAKDVAVKAKAVAEEQLKTAFETKEVRVADRERIVAIEEVEKDKMNAIQEMMNAIKEKDKTVKEKDKAVKAKNEAIKAKNEAIKAKSDALVARKAVENALEETNKTLAEMRYEKFQTADVQPAKCSCHVDELHSKNQLFDLKSQVTALQKQIAGQSANFEQTCKNRLLQQKLELARLFKAKYKNGDPGPQEEVEKLEKQVVVAQNEATAAQESLNVARVGQAKSRVAARFLMALIRKRNAFKPIVATASSEQSDEVSGDSPLDVNGDDDEAGNERFKKVAVSTGNEHFMKNDSRSKDQDEVKDSIHVSTNENGTFSSSSDSIGNIGITKLKDRFKSLEDLNDNLIKKLDTDVAAYNAKMDELNSTISELEFKNNNLIKTLEFECSGHASTISHSEKMSSEFEAENNNLKAELINERSGHASAMSRIEKMSSELEAENDNLKAELINERAVHKDFQSDAQKEIHDLKSNTASLTATLDMERTQHATDMTIANNTVSDLTSENTRLAEEVIEARQSHDYVDEQATIVVARLEDQIMKLNSELQTGVANICRLQQEMHVSRASHETVTSQYIILKDQLAKETAAKTKAEGQRQNLMRTLADKNNTIKDLNRKIGDALNSEQIRTDELEEAKVITAEKVAELVELSFQVTKLTKSLEEANTEIERLNDELDEAFADEEASDIEDDKRNLRYDIHELKEEIKDLREQLEQQPEKAETIHATIVDLQIKIEEYKAELQELDEIGRN